MIYILSQICICDGSERRRNGEGSCKSSLTWRPRKYRFLFLSNYLMFEINMYIYLKMHFQALEAALRSLSYDTLVKVCATFPELSTWITCWLVHQVKESIAREAACRELERQGGEGEGEGRREREVEEGSRGEERQNLPPSPHSPPHSRPSPSLPQYSLSSQVGPKSLSPLSAYPSRCSPQAAAQLSYNIQQLEAGRALTSFPPSLPVPLPPHGAHLLLERPPSPSANCQLPRVFCRALQTLGHPLADQGTSPMQENPLSQRISFPGSPRIQSPTTCASFWQSASSQESPERAPELLILHLRMFSPRFWKCRCEDSRCLLSLFLYYLSLSLFTPGLIPVSP